MFCNARGVGQTVQPQFLLTCYEGNYKLKVTFSLVTPERHLPPRQKTSFCDCELITPQTRPFSYSDLDRLLYQQATVYPLNQYSLFHVKVSTTLLRPATNKGTTRDLVKY